jgi:CubicO group peptidase (beta-lactamase class C family)/uncharacterized protein (DUF302 family)
MTATHVAFAQRGNPLTKFGSQTPDEMIGIFMQEHQIPGMTLSIVQAPYISRMVGYGTSDVARRLLASPHTLWPIGEMTQGYTAVAIMQLVEAGRLTVDSLLNDFLPGLPAEWQSISVRQLLGHASGLPDYMSQPRFDATKDYEPADILDLIKNLPLAFKPGTQVARSASDFFLLGLVIEVASGMTYEEFVTKGQIERLGLRNTLFPSALSNIKQEAVEQNGNWHKQFLSEPPSIDPTELATGYVETNGELVPVPRSNQRALFSNGALLASAPDISFWDIGLAGGILVKEPENRAFIYSVFKLADGTSYPAHCGWRFTSHKGFMDITGNPPGFSVYLSRFTDKAELVCVTLCANKEGVDLTDLARRIAGCFDTKLGPPSDQASMTCLESSFSVNVTMDRLENYLKSQGTAIIARVNHTDAAKRVGLDLRPTETLIFGNPAAGTHLMISQQGVALDLPLRMAAWLDEKGRVWLGWHEPSLLVEQHHITDRAEVLTKMKTSLDEAAKQATAPY